MKLIRFNESSDTIIEDIRDAFYTITDEYPLDVKFNIVKTADRYIVEIEFKIEGSFGDIDLALKQLNFMQDITNKCKIAISYLSNSITFDKFIIDYSQDTDYTSGFNIIFIKKNIKKKLFTFSDVSEFDVRFFYDEELFKKWFKKFNIDVKSITTKKGLISIEFTHGISIEDIENSGSIDGLYEIEHDDTILFNDVVWYNKDNEVVYEDTDIATNMVLELDQNFSVI